MTRAPDSALPDRLIRAEYICRLCGSIAGTAELKIYADDVEAELIVDGIVNSATTWIDPDRITHVSDFLTRADARALFDWEHDSASFYCPDCDKVFCQKHWQIEPHFDDDPDMPGWYDCTYGTCPNGHRRMIDD